MTDIGHIGQAKSTIYKFQTLNNMHLPFSETAIQRCS